MSDKYMKVGVLTKEDRESLEEIANITEDSWMEPIYKKSHALGKVSYRFRGRELTYVAVYERSGWTISDSEGNYYHRRIQDESVLAAAAALAGMFGEDFLLVRAFLNSEGTYNRKVFQAEHGEYIYETRKEGKLTVGTVTAPDGEIYDFTHKSGIFEYEKRDTLS